MVEGREAARKERNTCFQSTRYRPCEKFVIVTRGKSRTDQSHKLRALFFACFGSVVSVPTPQPRLGRVWDCLFSVSTFKASSATFTFAVAVALSIAHTAMNDLFVFISDNFGQSRSISPGSISRRLRALSTKTIYIYEAHFPT